MKRLIIFVLSILFIFSFWAYGQRADGKFQFSRFKEISLSKKSAINNPIPKPEYNYLISESFEGSFPPSGWVRISNGSSSRQWTRSGSASRTGSFSAAVFYSSANETMDEWLITPPITLSNSVAAKLIFWEEEDWWTNYGVGHYIKISTTSQTDVNSFQNLMEMTPNNHSINGFSGDPVEIDLSNYMGQTVYIAFVYVGSDADTWYIDDVMVREPQAHDVAMNSLFLEHHYASGIPVSPHCSVQNVGLNSESFSVSFGYYDWNGNPVILNTKNVSNLSPGSSHTVNFNSFLPDTNSEATYFAAIDYASDMDASNDTSKVLMNTFNQETGSVLLEKGTATWCGYCPGSALAADSLYKLYSEYLAILEYHDSDDYANDYSNQRIDFYKIWGFPTAIFNGTDWVIGGTAANGDWISVLNYYITSYQERLHDKTPFSLNLTVTEDNGQYTATAIITYLGKSFLKGYKLFFALNESHISEAWHGLDSLQFVAREFYPDASGIPVYEGATPPTYGTTQSHSVQFTIPETYVKDNCQLIAFIQNVQDKRIAASTKVDMGNLQNCLLGDVNMDNDLTPGDALCAFQIYLNGGQPPEGECNNMCALEAADVNCTPDGITPGDALNIFLAYLQGQQPPMDCVPGYQNMSEIPILSFVEAENQDPNLFSLNIVVNNPMGMQVFGADIGYPDDLLEFESIQTGELTQTWENISAHQMIDGVVRVGGYHTETIGQNTPGVLVTLNFHKIENAAGRGEIFLYNLKDNFSSAQAISYDYSSGGTDVDMSAANSLPQKYDLLPNYPNPFNMETKICYQMPQAGKVNIQIINMKGQVIRTVIDEPKFAGHYVAVWDGKDQSGRDVSSGIYWCKMRANNFSKSIKLVLLK